MKRDRPAEVACQLAGVCEVAARGDGLGMVGTEDAGVVGDGLLVQRDGTIEVTEGTVAAGQVGPGRGPADSR